jgi:hypothetical protein
MEVSGQLHALAALLPEKNPWYPLDRRLGGPQSRSGRGGEEKNSQPPPGIELLNPDRGKENFRFLSKENNAWNLNSIKQHTPCSCTINASP